MNREEYRALKAKDLALAQKRAAAVQNSKDPLVKYRNVRPIMDIKHMFESSVCLYPERTAFMAKEKRGGAYRHITYKEAYGDVNGLGTSLVAGGLKDKKIAIVGENGYFWAVAYLAVVCGAGIAVPLDKELPGSELAQLVITAECSCVIFAGKYEETFLQLKRSGESKLETLISLEREKSQGEILAFCELIEAGKRLVAGGEREFLDAQIMRDEMGVLLFTSGTTGISKGVMLSHGNIVEDIMLAPTVLNIVETDVFFSVLPVHHTYECTCGFLIPLYKGAAIAYCEGLKYITKNLEEAKPTVFLGVPALFENLYKKIWQNVRKKGKEDALKKMIALNRKTKRFGVNIGGLFLKDIQAVFGGKLRMMVCGGAAINPEVLQGFQDFGVMALQGYGLTESAPICALNPDTKPVSNSAGRALPETKIKIVDKEPETGIGEICISGGNVMLGYYNNPEATAEVLIDGWYHTGDLGRIDSEGYVYITGRKKNVIITKNGKNVYPEELEYYLSNIPYVLESMVWGKDTEDGEDTVIVASVLMDQEELALRLGERCSVQDAEKLIWSDIDKINEELPFFKRIKKLVIREEEFEKNTSKKIKRFAEANFVESKDGKEKNE